MDSKASTQIVPPTPPPSLSSPPPPPPPILLSKSPIHSAPETKQAQHAQNQQNDPTAVSANVPAPPPPLPKEHNNNASTSTSNNKKKWTIVEKDNEKVTKSLDDFSKFLFFSSGNLIKKRRNQPIFILFGVGNLQKVLRGQIRDQKVNRIEEIFAYILFDIWIRCLFFGMGN